MCLKEAEQFGITMPGLLDWVSEIELDCGESASHAKKLRYV